MAHVFNIHGALGTHNARLLQFSTSTKLDSTLLCFFGFTEKNSFALHTQMTTQKKEQTRKSSQQTKRNWSRPRTLLENAGLGAAAKLFVCCGFTMGKERFASYKRTKSFCACFIKSDPSLRLIINTARTLTWRINLIRIMLRAQLACEKKLFLSPPRRYLIGGRTKRHLVLKYCSEWRWDWVLLRFPPPKFNWGFPNRPNDLRASKGSTAKFTLIINKTFSTGPGDDWRRRPLGPR